MIDPGRLGTEGRTVRCAKCKDTWFAAPEKPEPVEAAVSDVGPEPAAESPEPAAADEADIAWQQFASASTEAAEEHEYPASKADDGLRAATRAARRARTKGPKRRLTISAPALFVATLIIAVSAFLGRTHIVQALPATAALYASIGLPVNLRGLEFRGVRSELVAAGADTYLLVEGEIANISGRDAPVPPIEIGVRGAEGQMLYTWTNDPPRRILGTSDAAHFRARLAAPPAEARQILVRFSAGQDGAAVASRTR